jgi:hypothetical protein
MAAACLARAMIPMTRENVEVRLNRNFDSPELIKLAGQRGVAPAHRAPGPSANRLPERADPVALSLFCGMPLPGFCRAGFPPAAPTSWHFDLSSVNGRRHWTETLQTSDCVTVAERALVATLRKHYRAIDLQTGS